MSKWWDAKCIQIYKKKNNYIIYILKTCKEYILIFRWPFPLIYLFFQKSKLVFYFLLVFILYIYIYIYTCICVYNNKLKLIPQTNQYISLAKLRDFDLIWFFQSQKVHKKHWVN